MIDIALTLVDWVLRTASEGSTSQLLWAAPAVTGPAAGGGMYYAVHNHYRNRKATYEYERDARVELTNVRAGDTQVRHRSKTRDRHVQAWEQSRDPRTRVHGRPDGLDGFFGMFS